MTCPTAARLRAAWYATAPTGPAATPAAVRASRESDAYRLALDAYRQHRRRCPLCRAEWGGEDDKMGLTGERGPW